MHVNFADVTERHDQGGLRTEDQDGADRVAHVHVARKDQSFKRADDRGVAQIFLRIFQRRSCLSHLRFALGNLRAGHGQVALRAHLLVQHELIVFFRVFDEALGHHAVFVHLLGPLHIEL